MKVVIIEDEYAAANNLLAILKEIDPEIEILAKLESVADSIEWFLGNLPPDLVFMDIQLTDDKAFKIFECCKVKCPVVFTTAYNEFALKAFKVNSIDYILKPLNKDKVAFALNKFNELNFTHQTVHEELIDKMIAEFRKNLLKNYKKTFLIRKKDSLMPFSVREFVYFKIENGIVYGITRNKQELIMNGSLDEIEDQLDPEFFFRANRQVIVSKSSIREVNLYFNEKLSLKLQPSSKDKVIISKAKASEFKAWLGQ